jgi:hypothetical protein
VVVYVVRDTSFAREICAMMSLESLSIGERIVLVARMAMEAHVQQFREEEDQFGRQSKGADGVGLIERVTEDAQLPDASRAVITARIAEGAAAR